MSPGTSTLSELVPERTEATPTDLRTEFVSAYGPRVFVALALAGALFLLPFSFHNFSQGRHVVGAAAAVVMACLLVNAWSTSRGGRQLLPTGSIFLPTLVALGMAMYEQGLVGILWSYAAILLIHFALPRAMANAFNAAIVVLAVPMSYMHLGPEITVRVAATMGLTVLFTNIFSFIADARQRKEVEQRQRLDLIVRGTHSGTLEWHANGSYAFSRRLRQILGRGTYEDLRGCDFFEFVHPDDRERVQAQMNAQFRQVGAPRAVLHQPPDDFRLVHASGAAVWVHSEAIVVTNGRGRVREYIASFMDITERVQAQQQLIASHDEVRRQAAQLEAQNAQLREAVRIREDVERIARHDLKAPLASIAAVPRLLREARSNEEREHLLAMVERASLRVLSMVNLSLDLHRMEAGTYEVRAQPVDMTAVAHTVAQELAPQAQSKRVALQVEAPEQHVAVFGEDLLCYSIVANLAKNALEASPDGATVRIRVGAAPGENVVVAVHNAGQVPEPVRKRFFQKYVTHGKPGGMGLGAYSARLMARIQKGELAMNTGEEGTTLVLTLPASPVAVHRPALPPMPATAPAERADARAAAATVLLVDDDPYNVMVLKAMLAHLPLRVLEAVNGRAALDHAARERPDAVFMDLQMPIMGGLETLGRLRRLQRERGHPPSVMVAFSARDDEPSRAQCAQAGFDHYLVKPAAQEALLRVLRGAVPALGSRRAAAPKMPMPDDVRAELPAFVASRRQLLASLCEAARRGQGEEARRLAHKLAGSLRVFGFAEAAGAARAIENAPADAPTDWLQQRCESLREAFESGIAPLAVPLAPPGDQHLGASVTAEALAGQGSSMS